MTAHKKDYFKFDFFFSFSRLSDRTLKDLSAYKPVFVFLGLISGLYDKVFKVTFSFFSL